MISLFFPRDPARCEVEDEKGGGEEEASSQGGEEIKNGGEGDVKEGGVGQNGSFRGRSRWSQVVARVRLAAEKRSHFLAKKNLLQSPQSRDNFKTLHYWDEDVTTTTPTFFHVVICCYSLPCTGILCHTHYPGHHLHLARDL